GRFPGNRLAGQLGILNFSSGGGTPSNPVLTGFVPPGVPWTGGAGLLYDPVADKDVVWYGGTSFTGGGDPALTGDSRARFVVNPGTYVAVPLAPSPGGSTGLAAGGPVVCDVFSVWG